MAPFSAIKNRRDGFTIIELLIVVGIMGIIATVSLLVLQNRRSRSELDSTTQQIGVVLRDAQSRAVSQTSGTSWGVHFDNSTSSTPFFALFSSSTYATSTTVSRFTLASRLAYASSSLALGTSTNVLFAYGTGSVAASTSITLVLKSSTTTSSTISISTTGLVSY